jgi:hypothetical protein
MFNPSKHRRPQWERQLAVCAVLVLSTARPAWGKLPTFDAVEQTAREHFAAKSGYRDGDVITKSDVQPLIKKLEKQGFPVTEKQQGVDPLLPDASPLAQLLRTPAGARLMSQCRSLPNVYDRLERLCRFPAGRALVADIIGQQKLDVLATLCTPEGAQQLQAHFFPEPAVVNFDTVSGKVYTQAQLIEHLRILHLLAKNNLSRPGD